MRNTIPLIKWLSSKQKFLPFSPARMSLIYYNYCSLHFLGHLKQTQADTATYRSVSKNVNSRILFDQQWPVNVSEADVANIDGFSLSGRSVGIFCEHSNQPQLNLKVPLPDIICFSSTIRFRIHCSSNPNRNE